MSDQLHRLLQRQLRRLEISADQTPDAIAWSRFLAVISRAYASAAEDRYLIERSLDLSSREMEALYDDLRRTSETQIARERDRLRSILEAIADGLCVVDHAGCVQVENRSARALLGVGGETLKGGSVLDRFVLRQEGSLVAVPGEAALAAVATAQEAEARFDDSEFLVGEVRRPVACTLTPLIEHGQRVGAVFLFHDMSVLRRSEHDLRQANEALLVAKRELQATNDELDRRVRERTRDLEIQNQRLEAALTSLRRTQEQLVQAEKMASLGLLVAGIAHEIKNPLNFVTNFAELSLELLDESRAELTSGGEPRVSAVVDELHANLTRIHAHGHRADGIINSMLMHSRERPGEEVVVDFNALVRDHVALAYQGFRADDRLFRADVELHLAPGLPRVRLAYGDVARVIVNLISNACHALRERLRQADAAYRPTIEVTTAREQDALVLRVRDNGVGIPLAIQRRVFDPFFTTKPPGEGTGLGLSMSYDIIVQQLGGGLELDSVVDDHTEVRLRLPLVAADADA